MALDLQVMRIERAWGKAPGWFAALPSADQERLLLLHWWEQDQ